MTKLCVCASVCVTKLCVRELCVREGGGWTGVDGSHRSASQKSKNPTQRCVEQEPHTTMWGTMMRGKVPSKKTALHLVRCSSWAHAHTLSRQLVTRSCSIVDFVASDDCGHQAWRDHLALWRYTYLGQANPVEQQEKLENSNGG